ncbi:MAG: hypothetical protein DCC55_22480 [Chloroflexi bacterium]|nr:MAG: hypothetical protein DCC55_22480 [Chloroflexota bacterium]
MTHIIACANSKGGVLKTTTAATLAHKLALMDAGVIAIDADPQGSLSMVLGLMPDNSFAAAIAGNLYIPQHARGFDTLTGNDTTKMAINETAAHIAAGALTRADIAAHLRELGHNYDYTVIDTPPSGILQEIAILAADTIVIPVVLDYLALAGLGNMLRMICALGAQHTRTIILPTMYIRSRESEYNLSLLHETYPGHVCTAVPYCTAARDAAANAQTIWEIKDARSNRSATLAAMRQAYEELAHWITRTDQDTDGALTDETQ